jgi:hypothetical protein
MNNIVEKGASKVALFLLALQSSFLCGLYGCALTPLRMAYTPFLSYQLSDFYVVDGVIILIFAALVQIYFIIMSPFQGSLILGLTFCYNHITPSRFTFHFKSFHKMLCTSILAA